jgi:trk system potassium uptake protein
MIFSNKLTIFIELIFNGIYLLFASLDKTGNVPEKLNPKILTFFIEYYIYFVPLIILLSIVLNYLQSNNLEVFLRKHIFSIIVFFPLIIGLGDSDFTYWLSAAHLLSSIMNLYEKSDINEYQENTKIAFSDYKINLKFKPAQVVLMSFLTLIIIGAFLLMLPVSVKNYENITFIDALFIATSATCVTGLTTFSIIDNFTTFGQIIILILIQIGGLGIMTLSSSMAIFLGRSMAMKDRIIMQELLHVSSLNELIGVIIDIIKYTFIIELWGALILTVAFTLDGFEFDQALYHGIFHSVSAFCNAGFSLFNNSLESFSTNPLINLTISCLVILGGLGFIVLKEVKEVISNNMPLVRISLHTKIVIISSFILTLIGFILFFFGEFLGALDQYSLFEKFQIAFFQSVTLRTAGFNTIPLTNLHVHTIYLMSLLMFIGASPGSTGGGIKTTSFAILIQSIFATVKGRGNVEFFKRKVPNQAVVRVTALTIISIMIVSLFIFILMKIETNQNFLSIFFEVISAFGTVGLSLGITSYLTTLGKIGIILMMFIGRVGPLTFMFAIGADESKGGLFRYPNGRLMIG